MRTRTLPAPAAWPVRLFTLVVIAVALALPPPVPAQGGGAPPVTVARPVQREVIDWLGSDAESADFIDLELEKIRAERRKAEEDLQKLKEKMEKGEGKK